MNREWVEKKNKEKAAQVLEQKNRIVAEINECTFINDEVKFKLIEEINHYENEPYHTAHGFSIILLHFAENVELNIIEDFVDSLELDEYIMNLRYSTYNTYLDSRPVEFDGDIIITDPCYIIKHRDESTRPRWSEFMRLPSYQGMTRKQMEEVGYFEDYARMREADRKWDEENPDDWDVCDGGYEMGELGLKTWMTRDTLYGDWGCHTFNSDTKEVLGEFCADSAMVGVFDLNEVIAYNPEYDDHQEKPWCVTLIKSFKGTVQFVVEENKRSRREDFNVKVVGRGVNKVTGEPLNFITSQTSL
jgi:hypothetical protein